MSYLKYLFFILKEDFFFFKKKEKLIKNLLLASSPECVDVGRQGWRGGTVPALSNQLSGALLAGGQGVGRGGAAPQGRRLAWAGTGWAECWHRPNKLEGVPSHGLPPGNGGAAPKLGRLINWYLSPSFPAPHLRL